MLRFGCIISLVDSTLVPDYYVCMKSNMKEVLQANEDIFFLTKQLEHQHEFWRRARKEDQRGGGRRRVLNFCKSVVIMTVTSETSVSE